MIGAGDTAPKKTGSSLAREGESVWFCRYCGEFIHAPEGNPPKRCPTPGCRRPNGFGKYEERLG